MSNQDETFEGWCIVELLGHRRLGGYVREQEIAGKGFIRIDLPATEEHDGATQYVNPDSLYALTPTTEAIARRIAEDAPMPVTRWELRAIESPPAAPRYEAIPYGDGDHTECDDADDDDDLDL